MVPCTARMGGATVALIRTASNWVDRSQVHQDPGFDTAGLRPLDSHTATLWGDPSTGSAPCWGEGQDGGAPWGALWKTGARLTPGSLCRQCWTAGYSSDRLFSGSLSHSFIMRFSSPLLSPSLSPHHCPSLRCHPLLSPRPSPCSQPIPPHILSCQRQRSISAPGSFTPLLHR